MGKSHIFSFQLSGRKATTVQNVSTTSLNTPKSKAQRILGTEAIDLNIQTPDRTSSHNECGSSKPTSLSAHATTLNRSGLEEIQENALPIAKPKASSILGIFKEQMEEKKSISPRIQSTEARTSSYSWKSKREEYSNEQTIHTSKQSSRSCSSDIKSKSKYRNFSQSSQLAHIATYIDQDMSTMSELPGDYSMEQSSISGISIASQNSHKFNFDRPTSSSSCPVGTDYQKWIPGKLKGTYPPEFDPSQGSIYPSARPQLRSKNRSLPNPQPPLANTWSIEQNYVTKDKAADQPRLNSSSETELSLEESDIPIFLRSSRRSILANKYELEDSSPPEIPYLKIPEFADIQLSGPWNENLEDQKAARISYFQNSIPSGYSNLNQKNIPIVQGASSQHQTSQFSTQASLSHSPVELYSSSHYDLSKTSKEYERAKIESQHYLNISENDKIVTTPPSTSCLNSPVSVESQTDSYLSITSTTSTDTSIEDEKELDQKIPLFPDSYLNDWNNSPISSLCIDYDSASSATILKNEPAYQKISDKSVHNGTCSEMYSPMVLMEVARVGMVIQKTPVREMIRGRRKENLSFTDMKELPSVNVKNDFSLGITSW